MEIQSGHSCLVLSFQPDYEYLGKISLRGQTGELPCSIPSCVTANDERSVRPFCASRMHIKTPFPPVPLAPLPSTSPLPSDHLDARAAFIELVEPLEQMTNAVHQPA
eukprot:6172256-Pleurochrysis_carterae.AAC.6